MKVYIQSAGVDCDFNWKTKSHQFEGEEKPREITYDLYKKLHFYSPLNAIAAAKDITLNYCLAVRYIFISPDMRDVANRPIYINICVEGLTELQLRALVISYLSDTKQGGVHFWPLISKHFCIDGPDYDMQWEPLHDSILAEASQIYESIPVTSDMSCQTIDELINNLKSHKLSSKEGMVLFVSEKPNLKLSVNWEEAVSAMPTSPSVPDPLPLDSPVPEPLTTKASDFYGVKFGVSGLVEASVLLIACLLMIG